jgi:subtilisin
VSVVHLPPYRVSFGHAPLHGSGVDWAVASYGIPDLWKRTQGEGVTVAVIDTGIAPHYALSEQVVDYRNFTTDSDQYDTIGHGTHVAGVIAAHQGPAQGIAHKAKLLALKVLGHSGMGSNRAVAEAVNYASDKADIICMSLGSHKPDAEVHAALQRASKCIIVCAAGNDGGSVNYPAAYQETVAVGAVDQHGLVCEFSSRGREIDVAAPGQDITSTWLSDGYATVSGTSMAAPFVAGVLSLWVSARKQDGLGFSHAEVIKALAETCRDVGTPGKCAEYGWGLMDPARLLTYEVQSSVNGVTLFIPGAKVL